jgi:hypothetical protein
MVSFCPKLGEIIQTPTTTTTIRDLLSNHGGQDLMPEVRSLGDVPGPWKTQAALFQIEAQGRE